MDYDKYKNTAPYTTTIDWEDKMRTQIDTFVGTKVQIAEFEKKVLDTIKEERSKIRKSYHEEQARLIELFYQDAFKELGINPNHPKIEVLKKIAWDKGHSCGFSEIFNELSELSELFTD